MSQELTTRRNTSRALALPNIITREGERTTKRFLEFFTANIRNKNTRLAYARSVSQFLDWCEQRNVTLTKIEPMIVAAYIEEITETNAPQTVKQHLAALRMLFDWMVVGQEMPFNPAASVRGPRYSLKKGKTAVLSRADMRILLDSIDVSNVVGLRDRKKNASGVLGLRDRALFTLMVYSFVRLPARGIAAKLEIV